MQRTLIKICGITRAEDAQAAVGLGANALGFVFYPPSARYVDIDQAARLVKGVPPFVTRVGLFVNPDAASVRATLAAVDLDLLQFQGDEPADFCRQFARPYIKVARMRPGIDLIEFARSYPDSRGLLLDTYVEDFGGAGRSFDWTMIPPDLTVPIVLAGGLTAANVGEAIRRIRPAGVDVSSGVEAAKGIKDPHKIAAFVAAVKNADDPTNL